MENKLKLVCDKNIFDESISYIKILKMLCEEDLSIYLKNIFKK